MVQLARQDPNLFARTNMRININKPSKIYQKRPRETDIAQTSPSKYCTTSEDLVLVQIIEAHDDTGLSHDK